MKVLLQKSSQELPYSIVETYLNVKGIEFYPYIADYGPFEDAILSRLTNEHSPEFLTMENIVLLKKDYGSHITEDRANNVPQIKMDTNRVRTDEMFINILLNSPLSVKNFEVVDLIPGEIFDITIKDNQEYLIFPFKGNIQKSSSGKVLLRKRINAKLNVAAFSRLLELEGFKFWAYRVCHNFAFEKISYPCSDVDILNVSFFDADLGDSFEDDTIWANHSISVPHELIYNWDSYRCNEEVIRNLFAENEDADEDFYVETISPDKEFYIISNRNGEESLIIEDYFEGLSCSE